MNFQLARDLVVLLETEANPAGVKQTIFWQFFLLLSWDNAGNSEFRFPSTSMFPSALPRETLRTLGKQNSLLSLGPVINCLFIHRALSVDLKVQFYSFKSEICSYVKRVALPLTIKLVLENFSLTGKPFPRSCLFGVNEN